MRNRLERVLEDGGRARVFTLGATFLATEPPGVLDDDRSRKQLESRLVKALKAARDLNRSFAVLNGKHGYPELDHSATLSGHQLPSFRRS
jgi:hypothetical protein